MSKLTEYAGAGKETITDVKTPYLKIAQKTSEEVNKQKASYIQGLEVGQFFCAQRGEVFGEKVQLIVLATRKNYALIDDDNAFKGASDVIQGDWFRDAAGALRTKEGYKAVLNYSYLVITPKDAEKIAGGEDVIPMVLTLKATDVSTARDWNTKLDMLKLDDGKTPSPIFGGIWEFVTVYRENAKGDWYALGDGKASSLRFIGYIPDAVVDGVAQLSQRSINDYKQARVEAPATAVAAIEQDL